MDPVLARQGFGESDLILHWEEIVGERLAASSEPIKLRWPPRQAGLSGTAEPATLVVRVEGAFALDLQHLAGVVVERVNAHLGWHCVGRLALKQGPLHRRGKDKVQRPSPTAAAIAAVEADLDGIGELALRQALARLGAHVRARTPPSRSALGATGAGQPGRNSGNGSPAPGSI
jgi:hypothetical protein